MTLELRCKRMKLLWKTRCLAKKSSISITDKGSVGFTCRRHIHC